MLQQHHTTSEENNLVHNPQIQEKTSITPPPTTTRRCNFCKGEEHYTPTCKAKRKADSCLRYKIVPTTNMAKQYLDLEEGPKDDPDFYLVAHVDKDDRMRDASIACIRICPMWSQLYHAPAGKKGVSKDNGFLYKKNEKGEWRLVLPSTFDMNGKNYLEDAIKEAHDATAHGAVEKSLKSLPNKYICQPFTRLVKEYVTGYDTCQRTKYSNKPPLGQVTMLHVPARAWTDITMDFLKMSPVFTYCTTLYTNIPLKDDHMICFSRLWGIVCRQSGFMFLIPVSENFTVEKCTDTFDKYVASVIGYPYYIVFDRDTLFMSDHFRHWAARKGIKLEPYTAYHAQMDSQSEIANKAILQAARTFKVEGNEWLYKLFEIQLKLNSRDNTTRQHSPFFSRPGFRAKLGPSSFPHPIIPYTSAEELHLDASRNLFSSKVKQAKQANKKWYVPPLLSADQKVLLSKENHNLLNTSRKLKPRWVGPFRIQHVNRKRNNYRLDQSTDSRLSLIHITFYISKIKPYVENDSTNFPGCHEEQPG